MVETLLYSGYLYLIFLLISLTFYPLAKIFLGNLVDSGWVAAKVLGLLILAFSAYLLGIFHIVKFNQTSSWAILVFWFILIHLIYFLTKHTYGIARPWLKRTVTMELVFFILLLLMSVIRGFQPQINGLEKYMDFGFIMAILNGDYFPPKDMWWSGGYLNYYYFGHLWSAYLIKLTGINPAIGFNLVLALCFSFSGTIITEYLWSWTKKLWPALLGAFLHLGIGNLHFLTTIWERGWNAYWYPDASRLISHVITEFPVYSFVVYDLHAHVLNFGPDLLVIGFIGEIFRHKKFTWRDAILLGFLLGLNFLSNAWDLPIYFMVFCLMMVVLASFDIKNLAKLRELLRHSLVLVVATGLTVAPFWFYFEKISLPVLPTSSHSPLYQLMQLWGFWFFLALSFFIFLVIIRRKIEHFDYLIAVLMVSGLLLIIIPEFFYVKDIYGDEYQRANTVFKLTFQSWNLFAFGGGYIVWRLLTSPSSGYKRLVQGLWALVFFILLVGCSAYTVRAYLSGYGEFKTYSGLNGEAFLSKTYSPEEYEAINWIRNKTAQDAVIVEAAGDSYTEYERVSSFTGRATIVGWAVHEWLWRGKGFDPVGKRQTDVTTLYTTPDKAKFQEVISKYGIDYIYVGNLERLKYQMVATAQIHKQKVVFQNPLVTIFQVNSK